MKLDSSVDSDGPHGPKRIAVFRALQLGDMLCAVPALRALHDAGHEVVCVYTQPPRPAGRGQKPRPSPVAAAAEELGSSVDEIGRQASVSGIGAPTPGKTGETAVAVTCRPPLYRADRDIRHHRRFGQGGPVLDMGAQRLEPGHCDIPLSPREVREAVRRGSGVLPGT